MASTKKALTDKLRSDYLQKAMSFFIDNGEEVMQTGTGDFCMPVVDDAGNESWVQIVVKIPNGSRDGEPFDGYSLAEDFKMKQAEKKAKAEKSQKEKEAKIAKDKAAREAKAAAREKRKAGGGE